MKETTIAMTDFARMADAKSFALALMDDGVQFSFCPSPISISYPMKARHTELEDQAPAAG